jgi:hypothetical protein
MSDAAPTTPNPTDPKPEPPKGFFDKLGAALPVALTALATAFAGMSTGALTQAIAWRTKAGQDQAKSTNQWSLAGFKRDRALVMQTTAAQLRATCGYTPATFAVTPTKFKDGDAEDEKKARERDDARTTALGWLTELKGERAGPPRVQLPETNETIQALRDAIEKREREAEQLRLAGKIRHDVIDGAIDAAEKETEQIDKKWSPVVAAAADLVREQAKVKSDDPEAARKATAAQAAGFELEERRYRAESRLNQGIGFLYDVRVRTSTAESLKYEHKSQTMFLAMLGAQIGAVVSSLAMGRKQRSSLWVLALLAGVFALAVGAYGFLAPLLVK